jgi:hypothetical protein
LLSATRKFCHLRSNGRKGSPRISAVNAAPSFSVAGLIQIIIATFPVLIRYGAMACGAAMKPAW